MKKNIEVPTGEVVGIGKLKIITRDIFPHEIPTLSFIVAKKDNGNYTASCLELMIDGHANKQTEAIKRMADSGVEFLASMFDKMPTEKVWDELHELFTESIPEWQNAYKHFQLNLAESGVSTDAAIVEKLTKRIKELENEREQYQTESGKKELSAKVIKYQTTGAAA